MKPSWRLTAVLVATFLLISCALALVYLVSRYPLGLRPSLTTTAVSWPTLPTPTVSKPNWQSFTAPQTIYGAVLHDGLLWAATDGGVVVWQWPDGPAVKLTTEHGLAENVVTAVAVGPDGALWFGTQSAGISRFDGRHWQTFTQQDGLPSNRINDLLLTADGQLWAATDDGIGQYDGRRWYSHNRTLSLLQLPGDTVQTLAVGVDGTTVWAGTTVGAAFYDGRRWQSVAQLGSQAINDIRDLTITPNGDVWAATPAGLLQYDGSRWQLFSRTHLLESEAVQRVTAVADGTVWLGYSEAGLGLTLFDPLTAVGRHYSLPASDIPAYVPLALADGLLTALSGELRFVGHDGREHRFILPTELPSQHIEQLLWANGQLWAAGTFGVSRFDGTAWQADGPELEQTTAVAALQQTADGQLVLAFTAVDQGIALFDAAQQAWQRYRCPQASPPSPLVRAGLQTADGAYWFATDRGLARFDGLQWQTMGIADGLPSDNVQALSHNGRALFAATDAGLAFYDGARWQLLLADDVRSLSSDANGGLWYFNDRDLYHLAPDDGTLTAVATPPLSWVYDQLVTEDGVWLASDTGIHWWPALRPSGTAWHTFNETDGLPAGNITAIGQTADGRLWAGSEDGLVAWQPDGRWQVVAGKNWQELLPITRLVAAADGSLLIGTYAGQLWRYGQNQFENVTQTHYGDKNWPVSAIIPSDDGALWLAHFGGGVSYQQAGQWRYVVADKLLPTAVANSVAISGAGQAWVGTDKGLLQLNFGDSGVGCAWTHTEGAPLWQATTADAAGQLWLVNGQTLWQLVGSQERRMGSAALPLTAVAADGSMWNVSKEGLMRYTDGRYHTLPLPETVAATEVQSIAIAPNLQPWLATTHGAYWFDGLDWQRVTAVDGLAANDVRQVTVAADGTVWLATAGGISRLRP